MAPHVPLIGEEKLYRIGVNADCPVHHVYAGGQCFPRTSEKVTGYGAETQRDKLKGAIVRLLPGQLEKCFKDAGHKVIRSTSGKRARSRVYDTNSKNDRAMPGDQPVAQFMYSVCIETIENPFEGAKYPTLAETMGKPTGASKAAETSLQAAKADYVAKAAPVAGEARQYLV